MSKFSWMLWARRRSSRLSLGRDDGFHQLLPQAAEHLDELIAEFEQEQDDHGLRCWLSELIGAAGSLAGLPVLRAQLDSDDESLRYWAAIGLIKLNTPRRGKSSGVPEPTARSASQGPIFAAGVLGCSPRGL
jgi:hypothetical protein